MIQKTIRFYDNAPADISALQLLNDCKKYGFNNAREMIITAVNNYVQGSITNPPALEEKDIDRLADKIAMRIKNTNVNIFNEVQSEVKNEEKTDSNDNYQKALSFLDTL